MDVLFPASWAEMLKLISNPFTMAIVLSIFIEAMPFIKNDKVSDWLKLLFVLVVCLLWSTAISLLTLQDGQTITRAWIYSDLALGIGVMFNTQVFHTIANNLPQLKAFLLALLGRPASTTQTTIDITAKSSGDVPVGTLGGTAAQAGPSAATPANPLAAVPGQG